MLQRCAVAILVTSYLFYDQTLGSVTHLLNELQSPLWNNVKRKPDSFVHMAKSNSRISVFFFKFMVVATHFDVKPGHS